MARPPCARCVNCAKLRLVQTTGEVEKLPSACRAAPAHVVLCLTSGSLFRPATPLLPRVKKGSAKIEMLIDGKIVIEDTVNLK